MDREGVADDIYINFFSVDSEAAMLACDQYGVDPASLLYQPKENYVETGDEVEQVVLVRYTICERSRQGMFRTLLGAKTKLLRKGNVEALWEERSRTMPDALPCPYFSKEELERAAVALDTDSEGEDEKQVDERGMLKPPLSFTVDASGPHVGLADRAEHHGETEDVSSSATDEWMELRKGSHLQQDLKVRPASNSSESAAKEAEDIDAPALVNPAVATSLDAKRMTQQPIDDGTRLGSAGAGVPSHAKVKLLRRPPSIPQPYFPRSSATLSQEAAELETTQKKLAQYGKRVGKRHRAHLQNRAATVSNGKESVSLPPLTSSTPPTDAAAQSFLKSAAQRNQRELHVLNRVARGHLRSLSERYERACAIDEEMEDVPVLGTVEHMLKYQQSIGVTPEFQDRLQTDAEREEAREAALQEMREEECRRQAAIEETERRKEELLGQVRKRDGGVFLESRRTHRLLTEKRQEAVHRQQATHLEKVLRRAAYRHQKADAFLNAKRSAAELSRYNHEQQKVYRAQLWDTIREETIRKTFELDVEDEEMEMEY